MDAGADMFLAKPVSVEDLVAGVSKLVGLPVASLETT
jgi:DNA-binding response OmpR family regulator